MVVVVFAKVPGFFTWDVSHFEECLSKDGSLGSMLVCYLKVLTARGNRVILGAPAFFRLHPNAQCFCCSWLSVTDMLRGLA